MNQLSFAQMKFWHALAALIWVSHLRQIALTHSHLYCPKITAPYYTAIANNPEAQKIEEEELSVVSHSHHSNTLLFCDKATTRINTQHNSTQRNNTQQDTQ